MTDITTPCSGDANSLTKGGGAVIDVIMGNSLGSATIKKGLRTSALKDNAAVH